MAHLGIGGAKNPAPQDWIEFLLMDRFKWEREYVQSLPLGYGMRLLTMMSAEAKANKRG